MSNPEKAALVATAVPQWRPPPDDLVLNSDEVHVWQASLDQAPFQVRLLQDTLSTDERARAERFYFEKDRQRFIVARGVLRAILGRYLNRAPEALGFLYNAYGKPALAGEPDGTPIHFNLSHSHDIALYAVTRHREVGIDLERIRLDLAFEDIAERFFSPAEAETLRTLPTEIQRQTFFRFWTRKEAYAKARGEGLSLPLDQLDVLLTPGPSEVASGDPAGSPKAAGWSFQEPTPAPGYAAALAMQGHGLRLACWRWPGPGRRSV